MLRVRSAFWSPRSDGQYECLRVVGCLLVGKDEGPPVLEMGDASFDGDLGRGVGETGILVVCHQPFRCSRCLPRRLRGGVTTWPP